MVQKCVFRPKNVFFFRPNYVFPFYKNVSSKNVLLSGGGGVYYYYYWGEGMYLLFFPFWGEYQNFSGTQEECVFFYGAQGHVKIIVVCYSILHGKNLMKLLIQNIKFFQTYFADIYFFFWGSLGGKGLVSLFPWCSRIDR